MNISEVSVVIAIGGKGTRLQKITGETPKPLFPVEGISTLKRCLDELNQYGFQKIILSTCFRKDLFQEFLSENRKFFKELIIFEENKPLGECGALWKIRDMLSPQTLFINGDLIFSIDLERLYKFHNRLSADITLVTHPSSHPEDSDMISCPNGTFIEKLFFKSRDSQEDKTLPLLGFSGISIFNTSIIDDFSPKKEEAVNNLFSLLVGNSFKNNKRIYSYNTSEYIKDMGTEKRYFEVSKAVRENLLKKKNYSNPQKALFLDRDNTLIKCEKGSYILSLKDIIFIDKNIKKIAQFSNKYSIIAIVTNQPQISMNKLSLETLEEINNYIIHYCRTKSLLIDTVIWCPHHPHKGYEDEYKLLKSDCFCRKPNPGMLFELSNERNINLNASLLVGDSKNDEYAAKSAGCKFINVVDL